MSDDLLVVRGSARPGGHATLGLLFAGCAARSPGVGAPTPLDSLRSESLVIVGEKAVRRLPLVARTYLKIP